MVDGGIEVLESELPIVFFREVGEATQGVGGRDPVAAADVVPRAHGEARRVEDGAVQIESGRVDDGRPIDRDARRRQEFLATVDAGEVPAQISGHRGEDGARACEILEILGAPVPDLDFESAVVNLSHPIAERELQKEHLGGGRQSDRHQGTGTITSRTMASRRASASRNCRSVTFAAPKSSNSSARIPSGS